MGTILDDEDNKTKDKEDSNSSDGAHYKDNPDPTTKKNSNR